MNKTILYRLIAINAILISGLIHLYIARLEAREVSSITVLFYGHFTGTLISAMGIALSGRLWAWTLGGFVAAGGIIDYLISRTVGFPSFGIMNWGPPLAYFTILLELAFFVPFVASYPASLRRAD